MRSNGRTVLGVTAFVFSAVVIVAAGCTTASGRGVVAGGDGAGEAAARPTVALGECTLGVEVFLWRDTMPRIDEEPPGLLSSITISVVRCGGAEPLRGTDLTVEDVVFEHRGEMWQPRDVETIPAGQPGAVMLRIAAGPRWEAGSTVTVRFDVVDTRDGTRANVLIAAVPIATTN